MVGGGGVGVEIFNKYTNMKNIHQSTALVLGGADGQGSDTKVKWKRGGYILQRDRYGHTHSTHARTHTRVCVRARSLGQADGGGLKGRQ